MRTIDLLFTKKVKKMATLNVPYLGYTRIRLIEKLEYKWIVELPSGKQILVYEDEFIKD